MIDFVIYSNILLYQAKLEQIIFNYMKNKKINYNIIINKNISTNNLKIYIIDLEDRKNLNYIKKISNENTLIIYFTYDLSNKNILIQRHLKVDRIISKKLINYQEQFINIFDEFLNCKYIEQQQLEYKNYKIPLDEIDSINILSNSLIIKATNNLKQSYTCNVDTTLDNIRNQLNDKFQIVNNYYIVKNNLKVNRKHKIYSEKLKEKIIKLYNDGESIKSLSELYEPSYTTIYNWIKIDKYENRLKTMEIKTKKYDKISKIVNDEVGHD